MIRIASFGSGRTGQVLMKAKCKDPIYVDEYLNVFLEGHDYDSVYRKNNGSIDSIGDVRFYYNNNGSISMVKDTRFFYNSRGAIEWIGDTHIFYDNDKVSWIGDTRILYDGDRITWVGDKRIY